MAAGDGNEPSWPAGWHVHNVAETGSTNDDLAAMAAAGAPDRTVLVAGHQTAGRGRLDRRWEAPPGTNLLVSLLFHQPGGGASTVMRRVALAARAACARVSGVDVDLKWPNDLLVDGRKLAGLLGQRLGDGSVVAGLGLNIAWAPPGAASLRAASSRAAPSPTELLVAIFAALDEQAADVLDDYRSALATLGKRVRVELPPDGTVTGLAVDVDPRGRLIVVDDAGGRHLFDVGDVIHLRPAAS